MRRRGAWAPCCGRQKGAPRTAAHGWWRAPEERVHGIPWPVDRRLAPGAGTGFPSGRPPVRCNQASGRPVCVDGIPVPSERFTGAASSAATSIASSRSHPTVSPHPP